jgi:hypothetical protein
MLLSGLHLLLEEGLALRRAPILASQASGQVQLFNVLWFQVSVSNCTVAALGLNQAEAEQS